MPTSLIYITIGYVFSNISNKMTFIEKYTYDRKDWKYLVIDVINFLINHLRNYTNFRFSIEFMKILQLAIDTCLHLLLKIRS